MDIALLLIRLIIAAILGAHALQKLFGWFNGPGLAGATGVFAALGHRPARIMVVIAVTTELTAAILLLLGLLTPLGAAMGLGAMLVAGFSQSLKSRSFFAVTGGGEYPFVLAAVAGVLAFSPGAFSLDALIGLPWAPEGAWPAWIVGFAAIVLGVFSAVLPILRIRRPKANT